MGVGDRRSDIGAVVIPLEPEERGVGEEASAETGETERGEDKPPAPPKR